MDFGSFENTIDKNIETDKTSDKFDQQLQAYKDAGNSLTSAKSGLEMATASMHEAKDKLSEASDKANTVTKAIEAYIGKVKDITVKAKIDDADMEQARRNGMDKRTRGMGAERSLGDVGWIRERAGSPLASEQTDGWVIG